ncbi:MAG: glycosyltransferase family 2 protein [Ilumatobacteraceae bacterium]
MSPTPTRPTRLIIQIPCYNEEATLPATVADLPREVAGFDVVEWLVIDDGSADRTSEVARELGVHHVVRHRRNRGLAAAFLTGLDTALKLGADVIVNTDADNQYDASFIGAVTAPVLAGEADIVVGERPIESIPEFSGIKKRLQRVGSWVVRRFSGTDIADAASGFRAFDREAAMKLHVYGKYTYTMETLIQAGAEGLKVISVPIKVNPQTRPSRLVKSSAQYVRRSAATIVRSYAIYRPFRFFSGIAMVPAGLGVLLIARWLVLYWADDVYTSRLPSLIAAITLLVIAGQLLAIAFLADNTATSRRLLAESRFESRRADLDRQQLEAERQAATDD